MTSLIFGQNLQYHLFSFDQDFVYIWFCTPCRINSQQQAHSKSQDLCGFYFQNFACQWSWWHCYIIFTCCCGYALVKELCRYFVVLPIWLHHCGFVCFDRFQSQYSNKFSSYTVMSKAQYNDLCQGWQKPLTISEWFMVFDKTTEKPPKNHRKTTEKPQ